MAEDELTTATMLTNVRDALNAILLTGQEITIFNSRKYSRANLSELMNLERLLSARLSRESGYTGINTADFREY